MTVQLDGTRKDHAVILMTHTLDAPRELVWEAFTNPRHVRHWYGGDGFQNPVCEMDVRPGGHWNHVMRTPDGSEHPLHFVFVEVARPQRLVWESRVPGEEPGGKASARNTLELEDLGRRTGVRFEARFSTLAERDAAMKFGFAPILTQGVMRMVELLRTLAGPAVRP
jgi:uncharacterized protein YndB with AHSA1/START domain